MRTGERGRRGKLSESKVCIMVPDVTYELAKRIASERSTTVSREIREMLIRIPVEKWTALVSDQAFLKIETVVNATSPSDRSGLATTTIYLDATSTSRLKELVSSTGRNLTFLLRFVLATIILDYLAEHGKLPGPATSLKVITFFARETHEGKPTGEVLKSLAKRDNLTLTRLFHRALRNFHGPVVAEPEGVRLVRLLLRMRADDKILVDELKTCHRCTISDIVRSAFYEEISRHVEGLE